jgi:hypothetical protein
MLKYYSIRHAAVFFALILYRRAGGYQVAGGGQGRPATAKKTDNKSRGYN